MGHMIPGGTGFVQFHERVAKSLDKEEDDELVFAF
jgi:hypothetical protein